MKKFTALLVAVVMILTCLSVVACDTTVTVTLHYNDGNKPQSEIYDDNFVLPTPSRDGFTFDGWYLDESFGEPFINGREMTSNFDLYAKWTPNNATPSRHTLTFVYNDGKTNNWTIAVDDGANAILPPDPSRDNYRFDGWWTLIAGGEQWTTANIVTADVTLYARWTEIETVVEEVTVTLVYQDGKTSNTTLTVVSGSTVSLPTPTWENHIFNGWFTQPTGGSKWADGNRVDHNITLYAQWMETGNQGGNDPTPPVGDKGTANNPYTASEALAVGEALTDGTYTGSAVYVKGVVVSGSTNQGSTPYKGSSGDWKLHIADTANGSTSFYVFFATPASGISNVEVGDTVTLYGYIEKYNGVAQMYGGGSSGYPMPQIVSLVSGSQGGGETPTPPVTGTNTLTVSLAEYAKSHNWTVSEQGAIVPYTMLELSCAVVTVDACPAQNQQDANSGAWYSTNWRLYQSESAALIFDAKSGCTIVSIKVTFAPTNGGVLICGSQTIESDQVVQINGTSVEFVVGSSTGKTNGQVRITAIEIVYTGEGSGTDTHTHDFGDSYFMYVQCKVEGCNVYGRTPSTNAFLNQFVYDFDSATKTEIDEIYDQLISAIEGKSSLTNAQFVELFEVFDNAVTYLQGQLYIASTLDDIEYSDESYERYSEIASYFYEMVENYYKLFAQIDDSKYAEYFWNWTEWSDADIADAIAMGDSYSSENQALLDEIVEEYYAINEEIYYLEMYYEYGIIDDDEYEEEMASLIGQLNYVFSQFVAVNNQIAADAGYTGNRNYMDYSYANDYNREYSPKDVEEMRNYVKNYVGDIFENIANQFETLYDGDLNTDADVNLWNAFEWYPMFMMSLEDYYALWSDYYDSASDAREDWEYFYSEDAVQLSTQYVGNYFKWLNNSNSGGKVNFYNAANDLFKNGNYFTGLNDGAYTAWIPTFNQAVVFFGGIYSDSVSYYQSPFTFVHEFGHYYENVYNGGLSLSYDHDETQSQGNEMLFLAWLGQNNGGATDGYNLIRAYQLADILTTVIMSTAVDEFEQVAYSGVTTYNGKAIPTVTVDGKAVIDYTALYEMILATYVDADLIEGWMSNDYWQVAIDSPCYYISYAMSALVSVEIYVEAMTDGLDSARNTYFKLFTFGDEATFVESEVYGGVTYKYLKDGVTYASVLNWCGLKNAFDETLYKDLQNYFK